MLNGIGNGVEAANGQMPNEIGNRERKKAGDPDSYSSFFAVCPKKDHKDSKGNKGYDQIV